MEGKTIKLYLKDGNADGIIRCTMTGCSITVYKIPRSLVENAKEMEDMSESGIYFLLGIDEDEKQCVYVGQAGVRKNGNGVIGRILETHNKIDYWKEAIIMISSSTYNIFGPTELNILENKFCNMAIKANRYRVVNGNDPNPGYYSDDKEDEMNEIIIYSKMLISALGYKFLTPLDTGRQNLINNSHNNIVNMPTSINTDMMQIKFHIKGNKCTAEGMMTDDGFVVFKGSKMCEVEVPSCPLRTKNKRLAIMDRVTNWVLNEDIVFNSPSEASSVMLGSSSNGKDDWVNDNGKSLGEIESMQ